MKSHRKILYFGFAAGILATTAVYISYLFSAVSHSFLLSVFTAFCIITINFTLIIISIKLGERGAGKLLFRRHAPSFFYDDSDGINFP